MINNIRKSDNQISSNDNENLGKILSNKLFQN